MKIKPLFLLDSGHGGVINGIPQTAGKRSPKWDKGVLYEGSKNREITAKVIELCYAENICNVIDITPEKTDVSLGERVRRANRNKNAILLSIHCDAFGKESANGWSAFTYFGQTDSDKVASVLYKHAKTAKLKLREDYSDGDPDKEADFYILRETAGPAVLIENLFMTNPDDYKTLMSDKGVEKLARVIFKTIKEISENGLK